MVDKIKQKLPSWLERILKISLSKYRLYLARSFGVCSFFVSVPAKNKIKILFYDLNGLSYAGTQKSLQILAKYLNKEKFEVLYMYSSLKDTSRLEYLKESHVELIPFMYSEIKMSPPYYIEEMLPHIFDIITTRMVDIVVSPSSGYPEYPIANLLNIPIIQLNIFGSINIQKNIKKYLCISEYLTKKVKTVLSSRDVETFYIQSEGPDVEAQNRGKILRQSLGFRDTDFVFGRIGRPDDNIFDPIGLLAFAKAVKQKNNIHYLIMAPPPKAVQLVKDLNIPNVHFLPPTGDEKEVWAFHMAIDAMAHFRYDGETMGLNIAESMLCGKPIITHVSKIWNAHLEYLDEGFSRVAKIDNFDQYAEYLKFFADLSKLEIQQMGNIGKQKAERLFLIENNIDSFEKNISEVIK